MDPVVSYLRHLEVERRVARNTLGAYRRDLTRLQTFAAAQSSALPALSRQDLEAFIRDAMTDGLSPSSAARLVASVRGFYRYLRLHGDVSANPAEDLHAPRLFAALPRFLSTADVDALLAAPDVNAPGGLRDRALIEVLYATGLRVFRAEDPLIERKRDQERFAADTFAALGRERLLTAAERKDQGRPLGIILRQPAALVAILGGVAVQRMRGSSGPRRTPGSMPVLCPILL